MDPNTTSQQKTPESVVQQWNGTLETNAKSRPVPTDWAPTTSKPNDWTPSKPKVLQDYTKMEDDYGRDIDRLVKEKTLTDEQFQTYTNTYCWYCGRPYSAIDGARHIRSRKLTKQERKTDGVKKITTTYTRTVQIPECTDCKAFHVVDDKKTNNMGNMAFIIGYLIVAAVLAYLCVTTGETGMVLLIGIMVSLSLFMVVGFVGMLVLWPFMALYELITHEKEKNPQPKLRSENDVPQVIKARRAGFN